MNDVEIEQAISAMAEQPFDAAEFPFAFLQAFGNKEMTIRRLRRGESNKSDLGGVLQTGNIHLGVAPPGWVTAMLAALKASPATARARAKFVLATDGQVQLGNEILFQIPMHSSEAREFYPAITLAKGAIIGNGALLLRSASLEYCGLCFSAFTGLDTSSMRQNKNGLSVLQHPWLEHLPRSHFHRQEQD